MEQLTSSIEEAQEFLAAGARRTPPPCASQAVVAHVGPPGGLLRRLRPGSAGPPRGPEAGACSLASLTRRQRALESGLPPPWSKRQEASTARPAPPPRY